MKSEELKNTETDDTDIGDAYETEGEISRPKTSNATQVVPADSIPAEDVPTVPIDSLQALSALQPEISVYSVAATRAVSMPTPLVAQPSEYRRSATEWIQIWKDGLRLAYLPLSLMPILLGTVLAWTQTISKQTPFGHFHLTHFLGAIGAVLLLQLGAHLINDYYDYLRGVDTSNALGPGGLIQQGYVTPTRVLSIGLSLLGLGTLVGLIFSIGNGALLLLAGLLVVFCAYFYSATPWALSSFALGELIGFVVFGPLLTLGAYMVQTGGHLNTNVLVYSLPLGLLAAATIHANNMRDAEGDLHAGKLTLATLLGTFGSRIGYVLLVLLAYAIVLLLALPHAHPHLILITFWTLPGLVVALTGVLHTSAPAGFHLVMRETLRLEALFAILLAVALIITSIIPVLPAIPTHVLPF